MSKKWMYVLFVLLLVVPLALAACGGGDKAESLDETFNSSSGLSLKYPKGWVVKDSEMGIILASSDEVADLVENSEGPMVLPKDGFAIIVFDPTLTAMMAGTGGNPRAIATQLAESSADESTTVGEVKDVKVGDNEGARVSMKSSKDKSEGYFIVWQAGDSMYIAAVLTSEGELGKIDATAQKIFESFGS